MLLASVVHAGMADTKRWVGGREEIGSIYRPPAATPLSLSPNGPFQPPQWLEPLSIIHGGHWLGLDVASSASTGTGALHACGVIDWGRHWDAL